MTASVGNFKDLVQRAYDGRLKLPGFQRNWRWRTDKVLKLYDSLRLRYPIGSLLFLGGSGDTLAPRPFNGCKLEASETATEFLVLDGQQRLTAGIHIFYGTGARQYYLNLDCIDAFMKVNRVDLTDSVAVAVACASLDYEDGYLLARSAIQDPRTLLVSKGLLCTSILTDPASLNVALLDYVKVDPAKSDFLFRVVQPHFSLATTDAVPHINIDEKTSISAISRIFTTLNTTGQLLTPFELVVAILFPARIDLQKEVQEFRETGTYYSNMDLTGEILLQTVAMLADVDQKKANLPKSINASVYTQHKKAAFDALESLGEFLTKALGCGLDATSRLVPYDATYAPMACALRYISAKGLIGTEEASAQKKLKMWFVAAALTQRYQEGVHNKQRRDYVDFLGWLDDDSIPPIWIAEAQVPFLTNKSFDGALGKLVQCLINSRDPRDPVVTSKRVGYRAGADLTEKHHIFPSKFVPGLPGWNKSKDKADTLLNLMYVERQTNKTWLNADPRQHIMQAQENESLESLQGHYERQFISIAALEILKKPQKIKDDFYHFLQLRQQSIRDWIRQQFGFALVEKGDDVVADDELDDEEEDLTPPPER